MANAMSLFKLTENMLNITQMRSNTLIYNLLLFLFLFRTLWRPCLADSSISPIIHSPGIYYDPVTSIHFYNDFWKIITHVHIVTLEPHLNNIHASMRKTLDICTKSELEEFVHCKDMFSPLEVLLQSNFMKLNALSHIIASDATPNQFKRSLEFGGEILKFFFGTLDAEDARHYDAAINACQTSES